ncbi:MAG: hypothetical protein WBW93_08115 [Steroidobacteraceae bacterium]
MSALRRLKRRTEQSSAKLGWTIHFGVFALMLAVTVPQLLSSFSPASDPLDASWAWMLGYSFQHHLQWGKSIVFTYGPLGFLTHSYFYSDHILWALTSTANLTSWFIFGLGFACILRRLAPDDKPFARATVPVAVGWVVGATFLHLSAQSAVLGVLLLVLAIAEEDNTAVTAELALSGALLALGALIKSSALIVSLFALLVYPALWWYAGRRKKALPIALVPLLSFFTSFCALWLLSSQSFAHMPAYLRGTWAIVSGYTPAMSVTGLRLQIISALVLLSLFAAVLVGLYVRARKVRVAQCVLLCGVSFWAWKEGFTRQDWGYFRHPMTFYGTVLLIASVGTVLLSKEKSRYLTSCIYGAYAIALLSSIHGYPTPSLTYDEVLGNYEHYLALMSSKARRAAEQRSQTAAIQRQFKLSQAVLNAVGHASVNVIPSSLMMVQGYRMHLIASPVIQSYSAYTPYLDWMNARQIWDGRSADRIIYSYEAADRRYPPFDEPATFRAILSCYRMEYSGSPYAVLSHVTCASSETLAAGKPGKGALGDWIAVPRGAIYAAIGVHTNVIGTVANTLFKAHYLRISFRLENGGGVGPYRFVYPVAEDGLFVRYFIGSQSQAALLFSGNVSGLQRIVAVKIAADPGMSDYAKHFDVRFFD